ncbi:hypothetical protein HNQ76_001438 [Thermosulfuriphilus ammonigenes]|nr:hypothetical protein [Thermosulfuriphilus ammonigenes]
MAIHGVGEDDCLRKGTQKLLYDLSKEAEKIISY